MQIKKLTTRIIAGIGFVLTSVAGCNAQDSIAVHPVVTGHTKVEHIENNDSHNWFNRNYNEYAYDSVTVRSIAPAAKSDYHFIVVAGTWCPDTHRELPKFYKIIDDAGFDRDKVKLFFVDHEFKSPEMSGKKYKIKHLPTFIVLKGDKEKGRIVEKPQHTLEKDLSLLLK